MNDATTDAATIFAPLWKRKWLILAVAILVGVLTYEYYNRKPHVYSGGAVLYLGEGSKPLSNRALADQIAIINSSVISAPAHQRLTEEHKLAAAAAGAYAAPGGGSDFINIVSLARSPKAAAELADATAHAYIRRQRVTYLRSVKAQILQTRDQVRRIEASAVRGKSLSPATTIQIANLHSRVDQLETSLAGFTGVQEVVPGHGNPVALTPRPKKNAIFGFALGFILACAGAYLLSRLNRRTRSLTDVEDIYRTQILAALPDVRSPTRRPGGQRAPAKRLIEPLRRLHTTLQLGDMLEGARTNGPRVILFLSADAGDGRSTLIANLARVQADAGERVAVIEADFRRPTLGRDLDVSGSSGLAEVLSGKVEPGVAIQHARSMPRGGAGAATDGFVSTAVEADDVGSVSVLLSGGPAPNPPALLASDAMSALLRSAAEEYDYVLIDSPPLLEVSDAMPLLHQVDGIIIVARIGHTRTTSAERLTKLLQRSASAPLLGAVANCAPRKDIERYGFSWAPAAPPRRKLLR
jgi:Mrp family chromosome partitioning ATPase/capsular polysaccharide biosynthesis protein